ncbi:MAG: sugar isomerase domain-containing protein [Bacilli bacterium]
MIDSAMYFSKVKEQLALIKEKQRTNIYQAAQMMGDCMLNNGLVQLFGIKQNRAFAMELGYRAGGLMPYHQIKVEDLLLRKLIDEATFYDANFYNRQDLALMIWDMYNIDPNDAFILVSDQGNEGLLIEFSKIVKARNHKLIVVCSLEAATKLKAQHPSQLMLYEMADLVIDNGASYPDALFNVDDLMVAQISGISGNMIAQMLSAEIYKYLKDKGHTAPILLSANIKGADVHNRALSDVYINRWNS